MNYHNDPKFLDRQVYANSVDPDQTAARGAVWSGLHCLPLHLHLLDALIYHKTNLYKFYDDYSKLFGRPNVLDFYKP